MLVWFSLDDWHRTCGREPDAPNGLSKDKVVDYTPILSVDWAKIGVVILRRSLRPGVHSRYGTEKAV